MRVAVKRQHEFYEKSYFSVCILMISCFVVFLYGIFFSEEKIKANKS